MPPPRCWAEYLPLDPGVPSSGDGFFSRLLLFQQVICGHPKQFAQPHHIFRIRQGDVQLPAGDRLPGDPHPGGQLLLRHAPGLPQALEFFSQCHGLHLPL